MTFGTFADKTWNAQAALLDENFAAISAQLSAVQGQGAIIKYGAVGDGVTDDTAAFVSASGVDVIVPAGTYVITGNVTFTKSVTMLPGAVLSIASGVAVAFNGGFYAPTQQIFALTGTASVVFGNTSVAYAEWFGALGNGTNDDAIAAQAAINSMPSGGVLQLLARPYTFKTAVTVSIHSLTIRGVTCGNSPIDYGGGLVKGTQIIGTDGINCISVNGVGYFKFHDVNISLPAGATIPCVGLSIISCFNTKIIDARITNFSTASHLINSTDTYIERCYLSSTGSTVSPVIGLDIDGSSNAQNASVYVSRCIAAHSAFSGSSYGYYLHGNRINDTNLDVCESAGCTYGFFVDGSTMSANYGADIHFRGCVADGNVTYGFYVSNFNVDSAMEITSGWAAGGSSLIYISSSSSKVKISGMQVYGGSNGIYVQNSSQAIVTENFLLYQIGNCIVIDNSPVCTVANNQGFQKSAASANFINVLSGSTHCAFISNGCNGNVAGAFANGIVTAVGADYCNVIGNIIPNGAVTTPYALNLASNTHTVQLGTTA